MATSQNQSETESKEAGLKDDETDETEPQENTEANQQGQNTEDVQHCQYTEDVQQGQNTEAIQKGQNTKASQNGQNAEARERVSEDFIQQQGSVKDTDNGTGLDKKWDNHVEGCEPGVEAECQEDGTFGHKEIGPQEDNEHHEVTKDSILDKREPKYLPKDTETGDDTVPTSEGKREYTDTANDIEPNLNQQSTNQGHNVVEPTASIPIIKGLSQNVKCQKIMW